MLPDRYIGRLIDPETPEPQRTVYTPADRMSKYGPISLRQVQPASLDVRLYHELVEHPFGERFAIPDGGRYMLRPGGCLLASLVERFHLGDNIVARVEGKSSWARKFLTVHSAGFIDPGFHGDITLELKNDGEIPIDLVPGAVIAQVSFQFLDAPAERPYGSEGLGSHYQGQSGPTPAR